ADLASLVNEAALVAARRGKTQVDHHDFQEALDKLLLGGKREALIDERERRVVAYHEGGHALVAAVLPEVDPLYKVTIVPRGRSLGVTQFRPDDDRRNVPLTYLIERPAVAQRLDSEVEHLVTQAHQRARSALTEHRDALDRLAQALLQEEVLEREQVLAIVKGAQNTQGGASSEQTSQRTPIQGASNYASPASTDSGA